MEKIARNSKDHYILCGLGWGGLHILDELRQTKRPHVIIDTSDNKVEKNLEKMPEEVFIEGDATDNDVLIKAGIEQARGIFAVTGDDNQNLVISLTAKQLNPSVRVVAQCNELKNMDKMKKAGADAVVSPGYIAGMRMVSEMIRPTAVSFLDRMLRGRDDNLRVEELDLPQALAGKTLSTVNFKKYPHTLLLALKRHEDWIYNPSQTGYVIDADDKLIVMTTPEERLELEKDFAGRS